MNNSVSAVATASQSLPNGAMINVEKSASASSSVSQEDAYQQAFKLAKQLAEEELKKIVSSIGEGNMTLVQGPMGLTGPRGKTGKSGKDYEIPSISTASPISISGDAKSVIDKLLNKDEPSTPGLITSNESEVVYIKFKEILGNSGVMNVIDNKTTISPDPSVPDKFNNFLITNEDNLLKMVKNGSLSVSPDLGVNKKRDEGAFVPIIAFLIYFIDNAMTIFVELMEQYQE